MPDKKENLIKINQDYNTDLLFAVGKINFEEFIKRRNVGQYEQWNEMRYVAADPFFLSSFLLKLTVELRLQAIKALYGYSFKYLIKLGEFGGSITNHFKYKSRISEDRNFTEQRARLAVTLDIPIVYILKNSPTHIERQHYGVLEYLEIGKKISFHKLKDVIARPSQREISCYIIEDEIYNNDLLMSSNNSLICRVDLHKTFFVMEFYLESNDGLDIQNIQRLVDYFDNKICRVILSSPLLRDSKKLSLIGTYIMGQQSKAEEFSNYLISHWEGKQLYPNNIKFEKSVPLQGFR